MDPVYRKGDELKKTVALTFDDGPDNQWTPRVIDILFSYHLKATFMCVGEFIQDHPRVLRRIVENGHVIGNHSWNHPYFTKIPLDEVRTQIKRTSDEMYRVVGLKPCLFRPPYGDLNDDVIREIVSMDYKIISWSVDSLDWKGLTGPNVASNILSQVGFGSIVLQHCACSNLEGTLQALPYIIESLLKKGYSFATIPELLHLPAYLESPSL